MNFEQNGLEVAVIGVSGRFPEAKNVEEFWQNLLNEVEAVSVFSNLDRSTDLTKGCLFVHFFQ